MKLQTPRYKGFKVDIFWISLIAHDLSEKNALALPSKSHYTDNGFQRLRPVPVELFCILMFKYAKTDIPYPITVGNL